MAQFTLTLGPSLALKPGDLKKVGLFAIGEVRNRISKPSSANDGGPKAYSSRGPIYIPVTGKGRTKTGLKGREVLTRSHIDKAFETFSVLQIQGHIGEHAKFGGQYSRTGRSFKFENYAAYKRFLGHSGQRDLQLSGRMLGSITIVEIAKDGVTIGFSREEEYRKMAGNERHEQMWGFSSADAQKISAYFDSEILSRLG